MEQTTLCLCGVYTPFIFAWGEQQSSWPRARTRSYPGLGWSSTGHLLAVTLKKSCNPLSLCVTAWNRRMSGHQRVYNGVSLGPGPFCVHADSLELQDVWLCPSLPFILHHPPTSPQPQFPLIEHLPSLGKNPLCPISSLPSRFFWVAFNKQLKSSPSFSDFIFCHSPECSSHVRQYNGLTVTSETSFTFTSSCVNPTHP